MKGNPITTPAFGHPSAEGNFAGSFRLSRCFKFVIPSERSDGGPLLKMPPSPFQGRGPVREANRGEGSRHHPHPGFLRNAAFSLKGEGFPEVQSKTIFTADRTGHHPGLRPPLRWRGISQPVSYW